MGNRMTWETAEKLAGTASITVSDTIYAPDNKYGYKININHPKIRPLYERYKEKLNAIILSDRERHNFESMIFTMIQRKNNRQDDNSDQTDS